MTRRTIAAFLLALITGCTPTNEADLVVTRATLFDSQSGNPLPDRTVVIREGRIMAIHSGPETPTLRSGSWLDARGRLLTPGFIDVHHHTSSVLGDSVTPGGGEIANLSMDPDSITAYRARWAAEYLPYGVTTVREAGGDERHTDLMVSWMNPVPWAPDFYPSGGALVSEEKDREPYLGHTVVISPEAAALKVDEYHRLGFSYIKLYWRLREPEFRAAFERSMELGLIPYTHIDFGVYTIEKALDLGVRDFEHAYTISKDVLTQDDIIWIWHERTRPQLGESMNAAFFVDSMEKLLFLGDDHPEILSLINRLGRVRAGVTPTLHIFAAPYGLTYFRPATRGSFDDVSGFTPEMIARGKDGYRILASYVKRMFEAGVRLNVGTDCSDPGKSVLSEMLLLHELGIPMSEVLRIATWNGAMTLRRENEIGSIEPGKKANLVLFEKNPLENPENLLSPKVVIKDGVVHEPAQ